MLRVFIMLCFGLLVCNKSLASVNKHEFQSNAINNNEKQIVTPKAKYAYEMGKKYVESNDVVKAIEWLTESANMGYVAAQHDLSIFLLKKGEFQDIVTSYKWSFIYMLFSSETAPLEHSLVWLSLDELEKANHEVVVWLHNRNVSVDDILKVKKIMEKLVEMVEGDEFTSSKLQTKYLDNSWIFMQGYIAK